MFVFLSVLIRSTKRPQHVHSFTHVMPAPPQVFYHPYVQSGNTTAPQCLPTMCALGKTVANTTHYKTLFSPVTLSPHFVEVTNDMFSFRHIYPYNGNAAQAFSILLKDTRRENLIPFGWGVEH